MRAISTCIVSCIALFFGAALAVAQPQHRGPGGGSGHAGPPAGARPSGPPVGHSVPTFRGPSQHAAPSSGVAPRAIGPRQGGGPAYGYKNPGVRHRESPAARAPSQINRAERRQHQRAVDQRERAQQRAAERSRQQKPPGTAAKQIDRSKQIDGSKQVDRARDRGQGRDAQRREQIKTVRTSLSSEQHTRLHSAFDDRRARVAHPNFRARVGTHIPRRIRLFAVPAAVLAIVPAYAYYRYVVVDDDICIVDPDTYEIVDVIDEGPYPGPARPQVAALQLSASERALVLDSIGPDFPPAEVHLRMALGAEIPGSVELHAFPNIVLERVPKLHDYRFVVSESDVVIVDPRDRGVALVVER